MWINETRAFFFFFKLKVRHYPLTCPNMVNGKIFGESQSGRVTEYDYMLFN